MKSYLVTASLLCLGFACSVATAADVTSTWDGSTNTWSDDSHWDSLLFPNNGNGGLTYEALISGGTVTLDQDISIENLQQTNGTITGSSDLTISGFTTWTRGTMSGTGTTRANGGLDLSGSLPKNLDGRVLNNAGAATWAAGQFITGNGAVLNNQLGAIFDTNFDGEIFDGFIGAPSQINNAGTFTKSGGAGATRFHIAFNNTGAVNVQSGTLSLSGGGTSSGSFDVSAGSTLQISSGVSFVAGASVTGAGTLDISNGTLTALSDLELTNLALTNSSATIDGTSTIIASGMLTWTRGTMTGAGITNANGGLDLSGSNSKTLNGRVLNNAGAATWTAGQVLTGNGAVFNNQLGATFDTNFDGEILNGFGGAPSQINNSGTFTKSSGAGATRIHIAFNNTGAVNVQSGTLSLSGGGTSSGSFDVSAGSTLQISSGVSFVAGASVTGAGTLDISNGTLTALSDLELTNLALTNSSATIDGTSTIIASGMLTWTRGTMTGAGITNANGGLDLSGSNSKTLNGRVLNNAGAATWTAGQVLTGNGAVFNNQLGATFDTNFDGEILNGFGGAPSQINNAGTFTKSGGAGTTYFGLAFSNTGNVNVNSGTLKLGGFVSNAGSMNIQPSKTLTLDAGFINHGAGIVTVDNGHLTMASLATNDGALIIENVSAATLAANLINAGTIDVAALSNLNVGGAYSGTGNIEIDDSQFTVEGNAAIGGTLNINNTSTARFEAGGSNSGAISILTDSSLAIDGAFANDGAILVDSGGQLNLDSNQPFDNPGTLEVHEGTVAIPKSNSIAVHPLAPLQLIAEATLTEGTWIARGNSSIVLPQISGGTPFELRHTDAMVILDGPSSAMPAIDGLWTNAGTLELRGGRDLLLTGRPPDASPGSFASPFVNSGIIHLGVGSTLSLGQEGISNGSGSRVEGEGVIEGSVSAHGTTFSSNGSLSINQGSLSISTSVSNLTAGTLAVNVPMYVNNGGHFVIADGATLGGTGILELQDGLVTIDGTLDKQVRIVGPVVVGGTISDATLDSAVVTTPPSGGGFGLVNCFGENTIESGVVNIDGQLLVNDGTLTLGAGASIFGPGAIDVKALASAVVFGNLASTGNATITGSLAVEAGATAQATNWNFVGNSLVNVKGRLKSPNPVTVTGTIIVSDGGETDVSDVTLAEFAKAKGLGKFAGNVKSKSNAVIAPGSSPGMLTVGGNMTFEGGSIFELEIRDAQGISGTDYDLLAVESDIINIGTTIEPMIISLNTLDLLDEPGQATNFDNSQDYSWTIATAIGTISGFSAGTYVFDESAFLNDLGSGALFLSLGDSGHALNVVFSANGLPNLSTGDFDQDGDVDGRDFLTWQRNPAIGYLANWQANYGRSATQSALSVAVPEPSSLGTMVCLTLACVACLRHSHLQFEKRKLIPSVAIQHLALLGWGCWLALVVGSTPASAVLVVNEGEQLSGSSVIQEDVINHGAVMGLGPDQRLVFGEGYTLTGAGSLEYTLSLGTYSPGNSPAVVTGTNQQFGGTVQIELGGALPGFGPNNHDQINDTATLDLLSSSTLSILPYNGFVPTAGDMFTLFTWQTELIGSFGSVVIDPFFATNGLTFQIDVINPSSSGSLVLTAVPEANAVLIWSALAGVVLITKFYSFLVPRRLRSISTLCFSLACSLLLNNSFVQADLFVIDPTVVAVGHDSPSDGVFDSFSGPAGTVLNNEYRPSNMPSFEDRTTLQFSLSSISGTISSAILTLFENGRGGLPLVSFYGYQGDGTLSLSNFEVGSKPLVAQVQTSLDSVANNAALNSIDLTSFVQQAYTMGASHIGITSRVDTGSLGFFYSATPRFTPTLNVTAVPEASAVLVWSLLTLGALLRSGLNDSKNQ
ncbi:beta strand repeat-containing protein [Bythopirellula goksoeyrii]|nr:hypothetical protein [Bythopirellula goksoeyrii]